MLLTGTKRSNAMARHSPKYFGLEKGVSALNMILNHLPINTKVMGANEHESHHGFDLVFNNMAGVIPDRLSTDSAGSNAVNFLLYDLINIQYAPCYKTLAEKTKRLCGFKSPKHYDGFLIKPAKRTNKATIVKEWPNMQPILAAMLMKETTQHIMIKKLSSNKQQNKLKKAFWEYNTILFSIYFLRYIDEPALRRGIRIVLNRGEAYHKLYNAVTKVGGKKLRGLSEVEMAVWHQCTRLVTLIITYYNMYILSELKTSRLNAGDEVGAQLVERVSPLAVRHINLGGIYHYDSEHAKAIDIEAIVAMLNEALEELLAKRKNE